MMKMMKMNISCLMMGFLIPDDLDDDLEDGLCPSDFFDPSFLDGLDRAGFGYDDLEGFVEGSDAYGLDGLDSLRPPY